MKPRLTFPVIAALVVGVAFIAILLIMVFSFAPSADRADMVVEHRYNSLIGDLGDDVIRLSPSQSRTFNYTLEWSRDDTGLMTGFIQLVRDNSTGISSVKVEIGDSSVPSYYHELRLSDGQLQQVELIIPKSGSVTFKNEGDRVEKLILNLQLTYFAISGSRENANGTLTQ